MKDVLTIILVTHYMAGCHPCTKMIERSLNSLSMIKPDVRNVRVLITCDGFIGKEVHVENYNAYKKEIRKFGEVLVSDDWAGCGFNTLRGVEEAKTELVFILQHHYEIIRPVNFKDIAKLFEDPRVKQLRLNRLPNIPNRWDYSVESMKINGVAVCKIDGFGDNPCFNKKSYFLNFVKPKLHKTYNSFGMETVIQPWIRKEIQNRGFDTVHKEIGTFLLGGFKEEPYAFRFGGKHIRGAGKEHTKALCCEEKGEL